MVHRRGKGGRRIRAAVPLQQGGRHNGIRGPALSTPQEAALTGVGLPLAAPLPVGVLVQGQGHQQRPAGVLPLPLDRRLKDGVVGVNFLPNGLQLFPKPLDRQRLEHIADDVIPYGLLGILEVVVAAEESDMGGGPHLPHLPGQLNAGDEGHTDIGEQQIRPVLLHQLEGVQAVAGASHQPKAQLLPGNHGTDRLPELVLVVGHDHRIGRSGLHGVTSFRRYGYYTEKSPLGQGRQLGVVMPVDILQHDLDPSRLPLPGLRRVSVCQCQALGAGLCAARCKRHRRAPLF